MDGVGSEDPFLNASRRPPSLKGWMALRAVWGLHPQERGDLISASRPITSEQDLAPAQDEGILRA